MSNYSQRQQVIQLMITTWTYQPGELFEYNSLDYLQCSQFRSVFFQLPFPKEKPIYYFFHKKIEKSKEQRYDYLLERRKELRSDLSEKDKNIATKLKLMGGVKLYMKAVKNKRRVCAEPIQASKIERVKAHNKYEEMDYNLPFLVVRTFKRGYQLKPNQIIKFGKVQFQIMELNTSKYRQIQYEPEDDEILNLDEAKDESIMERTQKGTSNSQTEVRQCKVCYGDDETEENALITPCDCKGTGKYIHMSCLKEWIKQKLKNMMKDEGNGALYQTKLLFCEICKKKFPKAIIKNGKNYGLLRFLEEQNCYIALKPKENQTGTFQNMFYISFQGSDLVKVGRLIDNGVILEDQSVSRRHAEITLQGENQMVINDTESKYGTMIYEQNMELVIGKKIKAIQQGNTVFSYKITEPTFTSK